MSRYIHLVIKNEFNNTYIHFINALENVISVYYDEIDLFFNLEIHKTNTCFNQEDI